MKRSSPGIEGWEGSRVHIPGTGKQRPRAGERGEGKDVQESESKLLSTRMTEHQPMSKGQTRNLVRKHPPKGNIGQADRSQSTDDIVLHVMWTKRTPLNV